MCDGWLVRLNVVKGLDGGGGGDPVGSRVVGSRDISVIRCGCRPGAVNVIDGSAGVNRVDES